MAYNKEQIYKQAIEEITKHNLFFVEDVVSLLPIHKATFYEYFPVDSNEYDTIKALLSENKVRTKSAIRAKLFKGKGMELIALYKILANEEELMALNGQYHQFTQKTNVDISIDGNDFE